MYYLLGSMSPLYWGVVIISLVLGGITQAYIRSTYDKWSRVPSGLGATGAEVARRMLNDEGASQCGIGHISGHLTDNYNPRENVLHLSDENFHGGSVSSVAVACHEAGHAVQTAKGFGLAQLRQALVPAVTFAQNTWSIAFFLGMFMRLMGLVEVAIILFAATVVFQLVTLPVEIDASRRALGFLKTQGSAIDQQGARSVLIAAALTYVAGALVSIINLLYLLTVTGNRRR